jgi:hypothetical protein
MQCTTCITPPTVPGVNCGGGFMTDVTRIINAIEDGDEGEIGFREPCSGGNVQRRGFESVIS